MTCKCHLYLGLLNVLFPSSFPIKIVYAFLFYPYMPHSTSISSKWHLVRNTNHEDLIMQFPPVSSFFHPLRSKNPPDYSTLKHPQFKSSPQYEKPSFKTIHNNMQNHSSVQSLQPDRQQIEIQNIRNWMVAVIPWIYSFFTDHSSTRANCFLMKSRFSWVPTVVYTVHPASRQMLMAAWPTPPLPGWISTDSPFFMCPIITSA